MENENKNLQGTADENELQEKVRSEVRETVAEAAAEIQDEIDRASEVEADEACECCDCECECDCEEELPVKEPKTVSMKLSSLVLSLVGTAVIGALLLLLGMQIPKWAEAIPEGSTVATVDGTKITDADLKYYIYVSAMEYFQDNADDVSGNPADFDWNAEAEDGKTAAEVVKENALDMAIDEVLLMNIGDKNGIEYDEKEAKASAKMQTDQLISAYNEELVKLNAQRQALTSIKQYNRKIEQSIHLQAVQTDMQEDSAKYYPSDRSVLDEYISDEGATYKHILIAKSTDEDANNEEKKALAEEIALRIQQGESFEDLMEEYNEDSAQTDEGYSFAPASTKMAEVETAVMALGMNEVSAVIESDEGYHIVKRIAGNTELEEYWKQSAKIKVKNRKIKKLSIVEIFNNMDEASEAFEELYEELSK